MYFRIFYSLLLFFPFSLTLFSKPAITYNKGDNLYVLATSGLNLRNKPSKAGKFLQTISFGTLVKVRQITNREYNVDGISGYWVKVIAEDREGYLFDGYLSNYPPPVSQIPSQSIPTLKQYTEKYLPKDTKVSENTDESMVTTSTLLLPIARLGEAYLLGVCFLYNFEKYKFPIKSDKVKFIDTEVEYKVIRNKSGEVKSIVVSETYTSSGGVVTLEINDFGLNGVEIKTIFASP